MTDENSHIPHPLWKVELGFDNDLSGELAGEIGDLLEDLAVSVFVKNLEAADGDKWTVTLTTMGKPDTAAIEKRLGGLLAPKSITAEKLPEQDWLMHVHENFPPVTLGGFFIYGSHYEGSLPEDKIPLKIDAATAFGSGEHETTKGCLLALEELLPQKNFAKSLDMGCGSGILAIAMKKLKPEIAVTAVDIDPESVTVTKRHALMNGCGLVAASGDGYKTSLAQNNAPYDIVVANILAGPLIDMAGDLAKVLKPQGYAVLSGLLARQEKDVTHAQTAAGLVFMKSFALGDWRALVFQKP